MAIKKAAYVGRDCVACGNCVKYCRLSAITVHNGLHAAVDYSKCVGCGKCTEACPAGVIQCEERESLLA